MSRASPSGLALGVVFIATVGYALWTTVKPRPVGVRTGAFPHVLLISVDTLRRDHLPFYGYHRDTTPNLSRLAADAWVFDEAYAAHTNTAPSHASLFTGRVVPAHGLLRNGYALSDHVPVLAELLATHGYRTAAFISGFTLQGETTKLNRGFEHYDDGEGQLRDRPAQVTIDRAIQWIASNRRPGPMFVFVHLFDPHFPYDPPIEHTRQVTGGERPRTITGPIDLQRLRGGDATEDEVQDVVARYDGEIHYADHHLGRLLRFLEERALLEQSVVVFVADHGETLAERSHPFDHGGRVYEEQIRIPMFVRIPGLGARRVSDDAHHVDVLATVADAAGVRPPPHQGRSLLKPSPEPRALVSYGRPAPERVPHLDAIERAGLIRTLRRGHIKVIEYPGARSAVYELFDLSNDPQELQNRAATDPRLLGEMRTLLMTTSRANGGEVRAVAPRLDANTKEALRSLGYVD